MAGTSKTTEPSKTRWSVAVAAATLAFTLVAPNGHEARATAIPDEVRTEFVKNAEASCFEEQSKLELNKSRKPEELHQLCSCFAEKASYVMTSERLLLPDNQTPPEEEPVLHAVFDNCWNVNMK